MYVVPALNVGGNLQRAPRDPVNPMIAETFSGIMTAHQVSAKASPTSSARRYRKRLMILMIFRAPTITRTLLDRPHGLRPQWARGCLDHASNSFWQYEVVIQKLFLCKQPAVCHPVQDRKMLREQRSLSFIVIIRNLSRICFAPNSTYTYDKRYPPVFPGTSCPPARTPSVAGINPPWLRALWGRA